jgi:hypothetical protein
VSSIRRQFVLSRQEDNLARNAFFLEQARDDKSIPTVIPLTRNYQNTFLGCPSKAFENRLGYPLACPLHQGETRHTVLLDRQTIHLAHLRRSNYEHDRKKFKPFKSFNRSAMFKTV